MSNRKECLFRTWQWFRKSGVMEPSDGSWGVAERIALTEGNSAMSRILDTFPAWTPHQDQGYCVIEQRRADCCMETAFLFFLLHKLYGKKEPFRKTAENILEFLYFRSGLLSRVHPRFAGTWNWSHIKREHCIYFDDNAWMLFLALKIARLYPALDKKYQMTEFAMKLADLLAEDAPKYMDKPDLTQEGFSWRGKILLPHWGSLICMALSEAYRVKPDPRYKAFVEKYEEHLRKAADTFTTSEFGYALMGCTSSWHAGVSEGSGECARSFADRIVSSMNPETGSIPSEHYETPSGKGLADTIYTMNWALLGMQNASRMDARYAPYCKKIADLLAGIQDRTRQKHLYGCWRGLYDIEAGKWGGGDHYEGGSGSIYTGWTNAPIAWGFAMELLNSSLMEI